MQCFLPCVAIIIAADIKKDWCYRNNCGIRPHDGYLEHSLMKKNRSSYVFLPIFMFCYSKFIFRNLKDANSCMFSWYITTSSLWAVYFFPGMIWLSASFVSKRKIFTVNLCNLQVLASTRKIYVKRSLSWIKVSLLMVFLWPITLFDFKWHK